MKPFNATHLCIVTGAAAARGSIAAFALRHRRHGMALRDRETAWRTVKQLAVHSGRFVWGQAAGRGRALGSLFVLVLLLAVLSPLSAKAADRIRVDVRTDPWRSLGKVQLVAGSLRETCTGVVAGARTVITAAHCLHNIRTGAYFQPSSVTFLLGLEGGRFEAAVRVEAIRVAPRFAPLQPEGTRGNDWALLDLAQSLSADRALPLEAVKLPLATGVMLGGYAQDNPNVLTADPHCEVTGLVQDRLGDELLVHNCTAMRGTSGAPILARYGQGWAVLGINVAGSRSSNVGLAVQVRTFLKDM